MKKLIKSRIFLIIISGIIFGGIGIYAASVYYAKDVSYTPSDESWEVSNVNEAINELYANMKELNTNVGKFAIGTFAAGTTSTSAERTYSVQLDFEPKSVLLLFHNSTGPAAKLVYVGENSSFWSANGLIYDLPDTITINFNSNGFEFVTTHSWLYGTVRYIAFDESHVALDTYK